MNMDVIPILEFNDFLELCEKNNSLFFSVSSVKHGGGSFILWGCFGASGNGALHKVKHKMMSKLDTVGCSTGH